VLLAGCEAAPASTPAPSPSVDHAGHDAALTALQLELEGLGLAFEPAGPHHVLGTGADGVEVDLVGIPLEEAVLSVPAHEPDAVRGDMEPYLRPIERTLGGAPAAFDGWLGEQLAAWDGHSELRADGEFGDLSVSLRSTREPPYVVLTLSRS